MTSPLFEVFAERVLRLVDWRNSRTTQIRGTAIIIGVCLVFMMIHWHFGIAWSVAILVAFLVVLEYKLRTIRWYAKENMSVDEFLEQGRTGDFVFLRSYVSDDLPTMFYNVYGHALVSRRYYLNHIGIVIRGEDGRVYILHSSTLRIYDYLTGRVRAGIVLNDARDLIQSTRGRAIYHPTNLRLDEQMMLKYAKKSISSEVDCVNFAKGVIGYASGVRVRDWIVPSVDWFVNPENYEGERVLFGVPANIV